MFASLHEDPPWIARALYGLGNLAVTFNRNTKQWSSTFITPQPTVLKKAGTLIDANLFGSGKAAEVSGVIYSPADAWNLKADPHRSVTYVHNRTATVQLPARWLQRSTHYSVTAEGKVGTITRTDPEVVGNTGADRACDASA